MFFKITGMLLVVLALAANPWVLEHFFSRDHYIDTDHKILILVFEAILLLAGFVSVRYVSRVFKLPPGIIKRLLLLSCSLAMTGVALEAGLRLYLSMAKNDIFGLKSPFFYTGGYTDDDFWYYSYLWSDTLLVPGNDVLFARKLQKIPGPLSPNRFYAHWATSLEFDPVLGYKRKANVTVPGHETSNLGTRGARQYSLEGAKIVFYGDSMVESNASSDDTLTAKMEKKTGVDCLNYGVGGYGLDQIYLLFEQTYRQFDPSRTMYLIGVHDDDLNRLLLKLRQSAKPYFTVEDGRLKLHTGHIDAGNPKKYFAKYRPRFRLFLLRLLIWKIPFLCRWSEERRERIVDGRIKELSPLILEKFRQAKVNIVFVLFTDRSDRLMERLLQSYKIPVVKIDEFTREFMAAHPEIPKVRLEAEGHPTPEMNDTIADHIIEQLGLKKWGQG